MNIKFNLIQIFSFIFLNPILNLSAVSSPFPILLVISFDGFRYDYLDKANLPNFNELTNNGVRAKWMDNLFVSKTLPNHFSMATGLFEETHGIIGNIMYDPVFNETFDFDTVDSKWWDNGLSWPVWVSHI